MQHYQNYQEQVAKQMRQGGQASHRGQAFVLSHGEQLRHGGQASVLSHGEQIRHGGQASVLTHGEQIRHGGQASVLSHGEQIRHGGQANRVNSLVVITLDMIHIIMTLLIKLISIVLTPDMHTRLLFNTRI